MLTRVKTYADEMNESMQEATALCGFNSSVIEIEKKVYKKSTKSRNLSQLHHFRYEIKDDKAMYRGWRYYKIGCGKMYELPECPQPPKYVVKSPFRENVTSVGKGKRTKSTEKNE